MRVTTRFLTRDALDPHTFHIYEQHETPVTKTWYLAASFHIDLAWSLFGMDENKLLDQCRPGGRYELKHTLEVGEEM